MNIYNSIIKKKYLISVTSHKLYDVLSNKAIIL
jgi:hypothetical protein